jgi:hypothetical protein
MPSDAGLETLVRFLLFSPGELEMDRNRIARVRIEKIPAAPEGTPAVTPAWALSRERPNGVG